MSFFFSFCKIVTDQHTTITSFRDVRTHKKKCICIKLIHKLSNASNNIQVCEEPLYSIRAHEHGRLVAVGSQVMDSALILNLTSLMLIILFFLK